MISERRGHQARLASEMPARDGVRAAAVGEGGDHLPVGDHEHAEQRDDREGHRQRVLQADGARGDEHDDDRLGAVGDRRQRVEGQGGQALQCGKPGSVLAV